jgi:hypothetical protein
VRKYKSGKESHDDLKNGKQGTSFEELKSQIANLCN